MKTTTIDTSKARIYYPNGRVEHYNSPTLAYRLWLGLPKKWRAAFRGAHDARPVESWDMVTAH